jgi:HK97 gp10 family phage protein
MDVSTLVNDAEIDALVAHLGELAPKIRNKAIRKGLRVGAKIVRDAAVANAPVKSGLTQRSIKVRAAKVKGGIGVQVVVGERDFVGDTYYAAIVEHGWNRIDPRTHQRRWVEGKHWLQHSYDQTESQASSAAFQTIAGLIEEIIDEGVNK